ncbi:RING-H2 finger protein ATL8-like [Phragmites australis]|uniref:RING-H2 finger protein ATL8-like n=1 Tax=Phragmites australis TaxID=29695 RepID=UPI002D7A2F6C|nr:RING-H2 finger protein ATL8-like [Phragmites australis]
MARTLVEAAAGSPSSPEDSLNSDMVLILAGLLCALVCILGLGLVARCACSRRWATGGRAPQGAAGANKGVKKEVLRSLPTVTYISDRSKAAEEGAEADECAICLAEFEDGQDMRVLPQCGHGFHAACVDTWLRAHSSCPSCRRVLAVEQLPPGERCRRCGVRPGISTLWKAPCSAEGPAFLA